MTAANTAIGGLCTLKKTELPGGAKCEIHPNALGSCKSKIVNTSTISFTGCKLFGKIDFLPDCVATHGTKDIFKGCDVNEVKVPRVDKLTATVNAMCMQGWFQNTTGLTCVDFNEPPAISGLVKFTHTDMFTGANGLTELRYPNYIGEFATPAAQVMWPNNLTCIYYPDSIYSMSTNAASSGPANNAGVNDLKSLRIPFIGQKRDRGYAKGSIAATVFTTNKYPAATHYLVNTQEITAVAGTSVAVAVSVPNGLTDLSVGFFNTMPFNAFAGLTSLACITFEHAGYITNFPSTRPTKYPSDGSLRYFAGLGSA